MAKPKRLKIRSDGRAQGTEDNKHIFFTGKEGRASSELAHVAEELNKAAVETRKEAAGSRKAFLARVSRELQSRDAEDVANSRARIHEKHQKERRKARDARRKAALEDQGGGAELGGGVELGGGSSASSRDCSPAPSGAGAVSEEECEASVVEALAVEKLDVPARAKRRSRNQVNTGADVRAEPKSIADMEKEALERLSGGGLFG
eukprot:gnl/TRDRNA2_/TRDRNA2_138204_c2_seq2.p2 gnl/TRDRNA2_/TRDRNA2_138204_c2~~gnl/TRDRNA2_/TRDRNA2_138204_c2_seq2.p2  ORF type:complete len:205 (+),score=64.70 gnl/TRDRNA2_/TRDRNA2_138204_c2_seq2:315-929(+)